MEWIPSRRAARRPLYPCHGDTASFDQALRAFGARSTRFEATVGRPRAGRQFLLRLPSGRHALVANYDDFPHWLEFELELVEEPGGEAFAHYADLRALLEPLGLRMPDKSDCGFPSWR